ncbi:hypothetical protein [Knoellia sp. p5-6-4]|uniref:hypothetical protein n=1 Tax=unclassified Knoellia TaxID=2618719 RepID=UPI0023DA6A24|nr:hypothetical protein [Knoellia sp. p5-6-4]MDF2144690.1 hypothetical protein [Knoellia sp. p5-6-4]
MLDLRAAFGCAADALREAVLAADTDEDRVLVMDAFLMARRPGADAAYERLLGSGCCAGTGCTTRWP